MKIKLRNGVVLTHSESGAFLLDSRRGVYWHLNQSALNLIEFIDQENPVELATAQMCKTTEVEPDVVRSDYLALVDELKRAKLIEWSSK